MPSQNFPKILKLGTRGSALALVQAGHIKAALQKKYPNLDIEITIIQTSGDRFQGARLADAGGKGLFVKEIEEALLDGRIDFAVHSLKDLPGILPDDLTLACFPKREDPRDCFVSFNYSSLEDLPKGAKVGTSSPRREAQLLALRPDLVVEPIRGNVETRLKKVEEGFYDATILANAGLKRLQKENIPRALLEPDSFVPAVGQGILGIEIRKSAGDPATPLLAKLLTEALDDSPTSAAARAERLFLKEMGGDCYTPLAGHATVVGNTVAGKEMKMIGWLGMPDGKTFIRAEKIGSTDNPEALGHQLAEAILSQGGKKILHAIATHKSAE